MTQEEKAKRYDEALANARQEYNTIENVERKQWLEELFPELKASDDERIRGAIIHFISHTPTVPKGIIGKKIMIAWLEKQGEQKAILNVPTRDVILSIWDLGNEWKELTNGSISTEYGTQLAYIQKHWNESEYYLREKQGEHKPSIEMKTPEESLGIDSDTYNEIVDECIYGKQKSAWSNKEKLMLDDIIEAIERSNIFMEDYQRELVDWLKSLKERIGG